jgi:hypothetical protein
VLVHAILVMRRELAFDKLEDGVMAETRDDPHRHQW